MVPSHVCQPVAYQRCMIQQLLVLAPRFVGSGVQVGNQKQWANPVHTFNEKGLYVTKTHEWFQVQRDGLGTLGITRQAQRALGEIMFCRLPSVGSSFNAMETIATLEALKTVGEVASPVAGVVTAVNHRLLKEPGLVTWLPNSDGWLVRMSYSGALPQYLSRSRTIERKSIQPLIPDEAGLQDYILKQIGQLDQLAFDGLSAYERSQVHVAAKAVGLTSSSRGGGAQRRLLVRRQGAEQDSQNLDDFGTLVDGVHQ
mmetsp:Transcript_47218/g.125423  ORF Transcript_47218/g.125423 Transcript_47218/m.125423 type:complete len:256 (-) Transcript_47218:8-775(-)